MSTNLLVAKRDRRMFDSSELTACTSTVRVIDANDPGSVLADVAAGMQVIGTSLNRLGAVTNVIVDEFGIPVALDVSYGIRGRKRKYVPGEFVDLVDDGHVVLSIDVNEFKTLRDVGD